MQKRIQRFMEENKMIEKGAKLVLGVSGGADSVCLLVMLKGLQKEYGLSLYAVHVNHGIREEAGQDAEYVRRLCSEYGVPFYLFEEDIPKLSREWGVSEEEAGRRYRYQCFFETAGKTGADRIATAHHLGDQAETVLFHLVRGTNLSGMAGIRPVSRITDWREFLSREEHGKRALHLEDAQDMQEGYACSIIRPFLCVSKAELVDFLRSRDIGWREDITNRDNGYMRNRLRNCILPELAKINQRAVEHIAEFAECAAGQQAFFEKAVHDYMAKNVSRHAGQVKEPERDVLENRNGGWPCLVTDREQLMREEPVLAKAVIYEMLAAVCGKRRDISREHVQAVYGLLGARSGQKSSLPYHTEAKISYKNLIIRKCFKEDGAPFWEPQTLDMDKISKEWENRADNGEKMQPPPFARDISLPDGRILHIRVIRREQISGEEWKNLINKALISKNNYTKLFDCDTIKDTLHIRMPVKGDYFTINEAGSHKKLSRHFKDCKILEEARQRSIVVARDHEVLWLVGGRRCADYKITDNTKQILLLSCEGENDGKGY